MLAAEVSSWGLTPPLSVLLIELHAELTSENNQQASNVLVHMGGHPVDNHVINQLLHLRQLQKFPSANTPRYQRPSAAPSILYFSSVLVILFARRRLPAPEDSPVSSTCSRMAPASLG